MAFGRAAGGAAAFARRFFVVWRTEPPLFEGGRLFWGKELCGGSRAGRMCGGGVESRVGSAVPQKRRGAFGFFPRCRARTGGRRGEPGGGGALKSWRWRERGDGNEERVGGGGKKEEAFGKIAERFVWGLICLRQGSCSVERSIRGSSHKYHKYRANISPPSRGRKGLLPKA